MSRIKRISLRRERWDYVILLTLIIYATLYIARPICAFLRGNIPFFDIAANILLAIAVIVALAITYKTKKTGYIKRNSTYFLLIVAIFIYAVIIWKVRLAEEKIHFLEYGLLSFLIYRAFLDGSEKYKSRQGTPRSLKSGLASFLMDIKGARVYIFAFILVFILGWIDEIIQYILPNRFYDIRDVIMNGIGGSMGLVLIFIVNMDRRPLKAQTDCPK